MLLAVKAVVLDLHMLTLGDASRSVLLVQYNHGYLVAQLLPTGSFSVSPSINVRF